MIRLNFGSFTSINLYKPLLKAHNLIRALCLVLFERSILNLLHNASKELDVPGNLFLAISRESITCFLLINSFLILLIHHLKNLNQKMHYELIIFFL